MLRQPEFVVGVLSDTHLPYRLHRLPPAIFHIFTGVDLILHAGDVDEVAYLAPLRKIAPVYAVRGNIHLGDFSSGGSDLPPEVALTLRRHKIVVTHGHRPGLMGWVLKIPEIILSDYLSKAPANRLNNCTARRLHKRYPEADVVIFGHTHAPYARRIGRTLFFNPGAVAPNKDGLTSVGLLRFWANRVEPVVIPLGDGWRRIIGLASPTLPISRAEVAHQ
jgi:putative phosphoesterase